MAFHNPICNELVAFPRLRNHLKSWQEAESTGQLPPNILDAAYAYREPQTLSTETFQQIFRHRLVGIQTIQTRELIDRVIVCFGYLSAKPDQQGRSMSLPELERLARAVHHQYPEMPGMAFYGTKDDSPATLVLVAAAYLPTSPRARETPYSRALSVPA